MSVRDASGRFAQTDAESRFWKRVDRTQSCWLWRGSVRRDGYGAFSVGRKSFSAHRFAYQVSFQDPGDLQVCHSCDTPLCVNPAHLFLGTQLDNLADMHAKGRASCGRGDKHGSKTRPDSIAHGLSLPQSKLTPSEARQIRQSTESQTALAARFGVSRAAIQKVLKRETWRRV